MFEIRYNIVRDKYSTVLFIMTNSSHRYTNAINYSEYGSPIAPVVKGILTVKRKLQAHHKP